MRSLKGSASSGLSTFHLISAFVVALHFSSCAWAQAQSLPDKPTYVNVQVDLEQEGDEEYVYNILEAIENRGWSSTVYVTGEFALAYPEVVLDIHDSGHQIGVHGFRQNENLTLLSFQEQLDSITAAFLAVRTAVGQLGPGYISDFRPQGFFQNVDTYRALEELRVRSNSGFVATPGPSHPYHTGYGFVAIPVSAVYPSSMPPDLSDGILLCDHNIFSQMGKTADEYLSLLETKYDESNQSKEPIVMVVHAAIVGSDANKLQAFTQFLDYVNDHNGLVVQTDFITTMANPYIENMTMTAPPKAVPEQPIGISVTYTPTCYCPTYYLKVYGRYKGDWWNEWWNDLVGWNELLSWSYYHSYSDMNHPYTWNKSITIPTPPGNESVYLVRVVGRACHSGYVCWPTAHSYEAIASAEIELEYGEIAGIVRDGNGSPLRGLQVEYFEETNPNSWRSRHTAFTGNDGRYRIPLEARGITHGNNAKVRASLIHSPSQRRSDIRFEFRDDDARDPENIEEGLGQIDRFRDYETNVTFNRQDGGMIYEGLVRSFGYFRGEGMAPNGRVEVEFNDDDYSGHTSFARNRFISMWHQHMNTSDDGKSIVAHEYSHVVANPWNLPYRSLGENWANFGSCLSRGSWQLFIPGSVNLSANTYMDPGSWNLAVADTWYDLDHDLAVQTLRLDHPQTVQGFYEDYKDRDNVRTDQDIRAAFTRHGFRTQGWPVDPPALQIASTEDQDILTGVFADLKVDHDGDGLADLMQILVEMDIQDAGDHTVYGFLVDSSEGGYCFARNDTSLSVGLQEVSLLFDGKQVFRNRLSGEYELTEVYVEDSAGNPLDFMDDAYTTMAYNYSEFERPVIIFTGNFADYGRDVNGDGLFDYLTLDVEVDSETAGFYRVGGGLYNGDGGLISYADEYVTVGHGVQNVSLNYPGRHINVTSIDGPYLVNDLMLLTEDKAIVDYVADPGGVHETQSYSRASFAGPGVVFLGALLDDRGIDADNNGYFDSLAVDVEIAVTTPGLYRIEGELHTGDDSFITYFSSDFIGLVETAGYVTLTFDGAPIYGAMTDGPYVVRDLVVCDEEYHPISTAEQISTSFYEYTAFESPFPDLAVRDEDVLVLPGVPRENDPVLFSVGIANLGRVAAHDVEVQFFVDGALAEERSVNFLASDTSEVAFHWLAAEGTHDFSIEVDPSDQIIETNEGNNSCSWQMQIGLPDFTVLATEISPDPLYRGDIAFLDVTVNNLGTESVQRYLDVSVHVDGVHVETKTINLEYDWEAPLYTWKAAFELPIAASGDSVELRLVVDPVDMIEEVNEDNNVIVRLVEVRDIPPTFCWESDLGNRSFISDIWYGWEEVTIGFPFTFYGQSYDRLYIATPGFVTFGMEPGWEDYWHGWNWGGVPRIAPLWTLWWPETGGDVYYNTLSGPNRLVVSWVGVAHLYQDGPNTLQLVLYEDGLIQFGWRNVSFGERGEWGQEALTGVTDGSGNIASLGEGLDFDEGTLDYENRWCVWNGHGYDIVESLAGSVSGVVSEASVGLHGVTVDLFDPEGILVDVTHTDSEGAYRFDDVRAGEYVVSIVTPLGFVADAEAKPVSVVYMGDSTVDFDLSRLDIVSSQRGIGYWKHQTGVHLSGRGKAQESIADISKYMDLVTVHFNGNLANPVALFEVQQPATQDDSLRTLDKLLNRDPDQNYVNTDVALGLGEPGGFLGAYDSGHRDVGLLGVQLRGRAYEKAKGQLMALLLNIVSQKLGQTCTDFSEDGATVSQAVTYCNRVLVDDNWNNDERAKDVAEYINLGLVVPSGMIPVGTPEIAYLQPGNERSLVKGITDRTGILQCYPNVFTAQTTIHYSLPEESHVKIVIYNARGELVRRLMNGYQSAGVRSVVWDGKDEYGRDTSAGIYLCHMQGGSLSEVEKLILVK